jgi:hypothetical protein
MAKTAKQLDREIAAAVIAKLPRRPTRIRIGDLPRDMREELFGLHATGVNPDATERKFFALSFPVIEVDISGCDLSAYTKSSVASYDPSRLPPVVIASGKLVDGGHRSAAAQNRGLSRVRAIDLTGIIDPDVTGYAAEL